MHIISIAFDFTEYTRISRVYKRVYECLCEYIHMCSFVHVHVSRSFAYFGGPGRFVMNFFINYSFISLSLFPLTRCVSCDALVTEGLNCFLVRLKQPFSKRSNSKIQIASLQLSLTLLLVMQ